jgi:acetyl-CoA carboxylase carboxyltransferase component
MVIGQKTTLEEMGGARMHCTVSGLGDLLAATEEEAIRAACAYLSYLPPRAGGELPRAEPQPPAKDPGELEAVIPKDENKPFDVREVVDRVIDAGSWFELKRLYASAKPSSAPPFPRRRPSWIAS